MTMMFPTIAVFVIMMISFTHGRILTSPPCTGKIPHTDCDKYIQCGLDEDRNVKNHLMDCAFATFFDANLKTCVSPVDADCNDPCRNSPNGLRSKAVGNCRGYWECVNGKSEVGCCDPMHRSINGRCSNIKDETCIDTCFGEAVSESAECDKFGVTGAKRFRQITSGGSEVMLCPPGSVYIQNDCGCNGTDSVPAQPDVCKPELILTFDSDTIEDVSGNNNAVEGTKVNVYRGKARFSGDGKIDIQRFKNLGGLDYLYIAVTYTADNLFPGQEMAIVSNKCSGRDYSIMLTETSKSVKFFTKTDGMSRGTTVSVNIARTGQKTVNYKVENGELNGMIEGQQQGYPAKAPGTIKAEKCGLQIGYAAGQQGFRGTVDQVVAYICKPNAK